LHDLGGRNATRGVAFFLLLIGACRHDAGISRQTIGEREVSWAVEGAPIVDTVKGRKVAFNVELIVEGPVNFCPPIV